MEHISINMGERIREMRKSKSLTQEALAQAVGVSIQAVSKWETGQSLPDVTLLSVIADYFDISVDALFGRAADPVQPEAKAALFPEDDKLRVVQYLGGRLMSAEECSGDRAIRVEFPAGPMQNVKIKVEIQGSARIMSPVSGALNVAKDAYVDGDINGAANVQGDLTCKGNVNGSVRSGGAVNGRGTTATIRMEEINESLSGLRSSLSGLGNMVSGMFSGRRTGKAAGAPMNAFFSGELPDDDIIRVVQLQGRRVMSAEESSGQSVIRLAVDHLTDPLNVEVYGSATIGGDIHGSATSGDSMACGNIGGSASVGDSLTCGEIKGSASAGDAIRCGNIGGNATAGDGITCGTVGGSVRAGDSAQITGDVGGSVTASDSVTCSAVHGNVKADSVKCGGTRGAQKQSGQPMPDVSAYSDGALHIVQVMNGEILSAEEACKGEPICLELEDADGITVHIHGSAQIQGDVEGDVSAGMSVTCGDVGGDVTVQGDSDKCCVTCGEIEGNVSVVNASVDCGVGAICGDVDARGGEDEKCTVSCGGIEGNVSALNASVDCGLGSIGGNVDARGDGPERSIVLCGGVEGDVAVLNASVNCQDGVISGNVDVRGERPDKCVVVCSGVEGSVTARNATVSCADGSIGGDIDAAGDLPEEE